MAGLGAKDILRNITALEQLIEEINFQRAKEMRQCLMSKDSDTGFVMVHGTTYWTDLFVRHFLFQTDRSTDADDLLFFIRKKQMKGSRYIPKYQTDVEVYRKDSRKLPIGDPDIDWEETVYLNLIIHQFDYTLTLAVCTRTSPKELQVLRRHSQKVYASPSRRRMDTKGEVEEITYPNVCFHVDNFDEVFADMLVRDGEMVCVELVASDHAGTRQAVIFLGSIRYDALKRVYDTRASLSSKVAQRMMMGLFSGSSSQRIEFVRMKGPLGKGHAEMAVTKPKGSGVETPTSEPGLSLTDLWDPDWEDEPEDRYFYMHQRRLSDPSANFNTFINSGWVSRAEGKSRSENEGLDNFANGLYEIESGDVRDATSSCRCCSVVACRNYEDEDNSIEFAQIMCTKCEHFHGKQELSNNVNDGELMTREATVDINEKRLQSLSVFEQTSKRRLTTRLKNTSYHKSYKLKKEEVIEISQNISIQIAESVNGSSYNEVDAAEAVDEAAEVLVDDMCVACLSRINSNEAMYPDDSMEREFPKLDQDITIKALPNSEKTSSCLPERPNSPEESDPLLLPEVSFKNGASKESVDNFIRPMSSHSNSSLLNFFSLKKKKITPGSAVRVSSSPDLTLIEKSKDYIALSTAEDSFVSHSNRPIALSKEKNIKTAKILDSSKMAYENPPIDTGQQTSKTKVRKAYSCGQVYYRRFSLDMRKLEKAHLLEGEREKLTKSKSWDSVPGSYQKKNFKRQASVPFRVTKDGTKVYFLCDLKLDDGAYNPLWTTKGFTQTFHFWKESRRAQSVPLNAYLTYVTLPWFTIITDILDHRTGPILTF